MLVMIGSTDLTDNIEDGSYEVESEDVFIEWEDGNNKKHRIYVRERVKGKFNIICNKRLGMDSSSFLELIKENTENNVLLVTCWVNNKAEHQSISTYVKIITKKHTDTTDIFQLELEER